MPFSRRGHPLAEEEKSTDAAKARARAMELLAGQELSSGQLYERLAELGAQALSETVEQLRAGTAHRTVQDHSAYTYAPMLTKDMGIIDWTQPAGHIHNQVRLPNGVYHRY